MPFTDQCDLYGAIHEAGINLIISHMMSQRPSLFNYGTEFFINDPRNRCSPVNAHREVTKAGQAVFTPQSLLPIVGAGTKVGLDFCFQITEFKIDFHPGNQFSLPAELTPPLASQHLGIKLQVCGAIACPERNTQESYGEEIAMETEEVRLISLQELFGGKFMGFNLSTEAARAEDMDEAKALHGEPQCFCLDVYATATMEVVNADNSTKLSMKLEGLEIVDLQPTGLENSLECYLISVLRIGILPRIRIAVDAVIFDVNEKISLRATLPQPGQTSLTHNPAVEQDQVKVFINVGV